MTGRRAFYIARRAYAISVSQVTVISLPAVSEHEERSQHACDRLVAAAKRSRVCNPTHPFALAMIVVIRSVTEGVLDRRCVSLLELLLSFLLSLNIALCFGPAYIARKEMRIVLGKGPPHAQRELSVVYQTTVRYWETFDGRAFVL